MTGGGERYMDTAALAAVLGKKPTGGHRNSGIAVLRNNGLIEIEPGFGAERPTLPRGAAVAWDNGLLLAGRYMAPTVMLPLLTAVSSHMCRSSGPRAPCWRSAPA
jgi:hypothetical protein